MDALVREFSLALRAEHKKPKTISIYVGAAIRLAESQGITEWTEVKKSHVRTHISSLLENRSSAYANNQYRALQQFFKFLTDEEGIPNPMLGMKPPKVDEKLVPVIAEHEWYRLINSITGKRFYDVRDRAIFEFFRSTGARRSEVTGLKVTDLDLEHLEAIVTGKGGRMRIVRFDATTGLAISRYLRVRKNHRHASNDMLWIGSDGALKPDGMSLVFRRRCEKAGVHINPHRFRHDFSHRYLLNGGQETDLMQQNGWTSPEMLRRYGASAAAQRAREHYDRVMG